VQRDGGERLGTGCAPLDDLLGGGLERGTVTQIYGPPAAGKTNVVLSAAVETAAAGETAVIVDTEGLSPDRFDQILRARVASDGDGKVEAAIAEVSDRIVVTNALAFDQQEEAIRGLDRFAERAALLVVDSATGFYRLERHDDDEGETLRRVGRQVTHLLSLARKHDLAAVVTNQVFTDPEGDRARALGGHTLDHWTGTVVRLDRFRGGNRRATLEKHRAKAAGEKTTFKITDKGIVDGELA
jgi:DNA repair protein RadB